MGLFGDDIDPGTGRDRETSKKMRAEMEAKRARREREAKRTQRDLNSRVQRKKSRWS